jgi:sorbitol/mannitol transport system substrate-binding protein
VGPVPKGNHWLWIWSLAIPRTSRHQREALAFITWATSPDYVRLVGDSLGWSRVPSGTRASTYARQEYRATAAYAPLVLEAITSADPDDATRDPVPYTGIQYVGIPEFQGAGTDVSQLVAEALSGTLTVEEALTRAQERTRATMRDAGYYSRARRP